MIGIFVGLVLLMFLAFKGNSIVWVAPLCAAFVALTGGLNVLETYTGAYMSGLAGYLTT